jgi:hypothetical protein
MIGCKPKTQKAIGILEALPEFRNSNRMLDYIFEFPHHELIKNVKDINKIAFSDDWHRFARPCPMRPRHGFVESRIVSNKNELLKLFKEVKKQDRRGEILVGTAYKNVLYNAVLVSSGLLSVGPGNDGATGGINSLSFPVAPITFKKNIIDVAQIKNNEGVYLESNKIDKSCGGWQIVQMRGGPATENNSNDFIPKTIIVKQIVEPDNNLLVWEKKVKDFDDGTVVYGAGYTLASHAAVHCILHDVPFITTKKPCIGDILKSTENKKPKAILDRENFKRGVTIALRLKQDSMYNSLLFCLSVLHNWAYLCKSSTADYLIGAASTILATVGTALCFGEHRHIGDTCGERSDIYGRVIKNNIQHLYDLPRIFHDFYSEDCENGFGGIPWANCTWYSNAIWSSVVNIYNGKSHNISDREIINLIEYVNRTLNLAHNNGWWFNKVISKEYMDFAADNPGLAAFGIAEIFYNIGIRASKKIKLLQLQETKQIKKPVGVNNNKNLMWAFMILDDPYPEEDYYAEETCTDATLYIREEDASSERCAEMVTLSEKEFDHAKKHVLNSGKIFLDIVPNKGFRIPGGRIINYKGIKKVA